MRLSGWVGLMAGTAASFGYNTGIFIQKADHEH